MPAERHVPLRRCVACRASLPKEQLVRFVRDDAGAWTLDAGQRAGGRGTWLCLDCARDPDPKRIARGFRGRAEPVVTQLRSHFEPHSPTSGGNHG